MNMQMNLSIFITSRENLVHKLESLRGAQTLKIEAYDDDIKKFLREGLEGEFVLSEKKIEVINKIHKAAQGQ